MSFHFKLNIFQTIDGGKAKESDESVSFSVERIWQSYRKENEYCTCDIDDKWKQGVQEYYDGCRKATWKFRGPSYDLADVVLHAFDIHLTKLISLTKSNSTVIASSSTSLLESISKGRKLGVSGLIIIKEFDKVVLGLVEEFNGVVTKLSDIIGALTNAVNDDLIDLGYAFSKFMKEFIKSGVTGFKKKVDYEPVLKRLQQLMNTVALIAETLLNNCELATSEVNEAVTVLTLIVNYFAVAVQGINTCYQSVLYEQECIVPQNIELCSPSFEYMLVEITQAVDSVVFPFAESMTTLLTKLVNITLFLNTALKDIFGVFKGVAITVGQITKNLAKGVSTTVTGVTKELTNILKGVVPK